MKIVIDVLIQATYDDGATGNTIETDLELDEPAQPRPGDELDAWADEHLQPLTLIGIADMHATYVVTITRSTELRLLGRAWAWSG
jgi:hypothetical protein